MEKLKNNKKLIAIILIIITLVVIFTLMNVNKSKDGSSVNKNQSLKINSFEDELSIKIDSIDDVVYFSDMFYANEKTAYRGIKLSITNNSNKSVSILISNFTLLDSSNNKLASTSTGFPDMDVEHSVDKNTLLPSDIPAGQTISGYLYFETDSKDIKKLNIRCPLNSKSNGDGKIKVDYKDYYINL